VVQLVFSGGGHHGTLVVLGPLSDVFHRLAVARAERARAGTPTTGDFGWAKLTSGNGQTVYVDPFNVAYLVPLD
jgi:hypothetical protein